MSIRHTLPTLLSISILTLTACQTQPVQTTQSKQQATVQITAGQDFNYAGQYATAHATKQHYRQTLFISPITTTIPSTTSSKGNQRYHVEFSASKVRGRAGCSFSGTAVEKDGVL